MAYTLSPKDGMSNISGKHLVQKGKKKVAKVPTYTRIDKDSASFNFVFSLNYEAEEGKTWKSTTERLFNAEFISRQYCTTRSKRFVYATKLRTMIHSFRFEAILSFFPFL